MANHRRLRLRRRAAAARSKLAPLARPPLPALGGARDKREAGGGGDAWRDFAASFVAAGMVAPPEPEKGAAAAEAEEPGRGVLAAAEAKEGRAVLLLPQGQTLAFTGKCSLTCLYGSVRVFGFTIVPDQPPYNLFSPHSHCALTIEATADKEPEKSEKEMKAGARSVLRAHLVPQEARCKLMKTFVPQCSIVLLEHLDTPETRFILSHPSLSHIFRAKRQKVPCFTPEDAVLASTGIGRLDPGNGLLLSESLLSAIEELVEACQGPPFTHQRRPRKMAYFGETSCEQDTERYIDTLKYVFSAYERDVPLVVNTMGWVQGAGLLLLIDLIRLLAPSHVVQISAEDCKEMPLLSSEYLHGTAGLHTRGKAPPKARSLTSEAEDLEQGRSQGDFQPLHPGPKLLRVQPKFPGAGGSGNGRTHSSILRDMAVLGYLSQLQPPDTDPVLPLHSLAPYQVPFSAVALRVIHADVAPAHVLYSANASWVALCQVPDEIPRKSGGPVLLTQTPICDCLGFGIVRGVDMDKRLYYILTPVAPENLRLVNCLLIGNIPIPNCIFLSQVGIEGEIPYVTSEYNYDISGAGKLKMKKHLKRREHKRP
ncbi:polynucleotide 5'-hydroxyl-kinase NOL9 isoform X2 [Elgaria multicarinata webbii]|uniref:polynucleotide 5'-hydroxyl-kinase NOL9 isoform X2 n=1 Tax=Elgaria multicarinata webbii TaxID=159646 RepID=UPI002FCD3F13